MFLVTMTNRCGKGSNSRRCDEQVNTKIPLLLLFLFFVLYHLVLSRNFYGLEMFWGLKFGPGNFLELFEAPGIFGGFDFCPHSIIPVT